MSLHIIIPHTFSEAEALKRTKKLLQETKDQYSDEIEDLTENWKGTTGEFTFNVRGYTLSGTIEVNKKDLQIKGTLPGMLKFFKAKIETLILERANKLLAE